MSIQEGFENLEKILNYLVDEICFLKNKLVELEKEVKLNKNWR